MKEVTISISAIRLDFQPRGNLLEDKVAEYVGRLRRGEVPPPVRVRFDGSQYFLEDGFHRVEAARRINRKRIRAKVLRGNLADMEAAFQKYLRHLKAELNAEAIQRTPKQGIAE